MNIDNETPVYEAPTVVDYGSLRELTAGQAAGSNLDATFPINTPADKLTFSTPPTTTVSG